LPIDFILSQQIHIFFGGIGFCFAYPDFYYLQLQVKYFASFFLLFEENLTRRLKFVKNVIQ